MARQVKRLTRSTRKRILGGVCGGLAEYLGISATPVRLAYVLLSVMSAAFPGILIYLAAWLIIPRDI